jgi:alkylated DNA repair dioxygenase AlkB
VSIIGNVSGEQMNLLGQELPPGLILRNNWLSDDEHANAVAEVDNNHFETMLLRRVQHYGARYDYESSQVSEIGSAPPIPPVLKSIGERLFSEDFFERSPEQVIVNEYFPGQGIASHVDRQSFGPAVATISLLESWPMIFSKTDGTKKLEVLLEVKSLAVMTNESRSEWAHEIAKRKVDKIGGLKIARCRRLSLTYRTINPKTF